MNMMQRVQALHLLRAAVPIAKRRGDALGTLVNRRGGCCMEGALALAAGVPATVMRNKPSLVMLIMSRDGVTLRNRKSLVRGRTRGTALDLAYRTQLLIEGAEGLGLQHLSDSMVKDQLKPFTVSRALRRMEHRLRRRWPVAAEKSDQMWPKRRHLYV